MEASDGVVRGPDGTNRCRWCTATDRYRRYHDEEWGRPVVSDRRLYEKVCLEGFQAGLSWRTILEKREAFRRAFQEFEIERVARFDDADVERLLDDPSIVRHRAKIESAIANAGRALDLIEEAGSLASFFWYFEPDERPDRMTREVFEARTESPASRRLAAALSDRGWTWVGPTTMHSLMRATGIVNAHLEGCDLRETCARERRDLERPPPPDCEV